MAKWFYSIDGQESGPVEAAALKALATAGHIKPTDKVRREDLTEWYEAMQVKGLIAAEQPQSLTSSTQQLSAAPPPRPNAVAEPKGIPKRGDGSPTPTPKIAPPAVTAKTATQPHSADVPNGSDVEQIDGGKHVVGHKRQSVRLWTLNNYLCNASSCNPRSKRGRAKKRRHVVDTR